jgi:hypothetical protein
MTRKRNPGVVYSGTVKNALRKISPRKFATPRSVPKTRSDKLNGGPMSGARLMLADHSCTLPITMNGQTGRYVQGNWEAA